MSVNTIHMTLSSSLKSTPLPSLAMPLLLKHSMTAHDILHIYDCDKAWQTTRPIPDVNTWKLLRDLYVTIVGPEQSSLSSSSDSSFLVPIEARQSVGTGGGRGIFATQSVKKGDHIWSGTGNLAYFHKRNDYFRFIELVHSVNNVLACEIVHWSYRSPPNYDREHIVVDIEEGALRNTGSPKQPNNMGCNGMATVINATNELCAENLFALRDIAAGEELLCSYSRMKWV